MRSIELNAKAMHTLFCALGSDEYSRVSSCSNTMEIWDKLKVTHEGTSQMKKSKIRILTLNYETFKIKSKEDIKTMYDPFTIIINGLKSYGKIYPNEEVVRKMLRNLPKSWKAKVTAIEETKNLETLTLDELNGSLLTHEMRLNEGVEKEKDQEVANLCLMVIDDSKVTSNLSSSISYSFGEL
ncbi:UBN2 domain-containing protein [Gossypium australe]|uniref:UBN2 domain-containing protein n=1 Tax=Gossypium australe TaxID=47621 RepID=A0A5B6WHL9_9ROSI|nr:UBN2 domain-containing protein [Gossypium australe]